MTVAHHASRTSLTDLLLCESILKKKLQKKGRNYDHIAMELRKKMTNFPPAAIGSLSAASLEQRYRQLESEFGRHMPVEAMMQKARQQRLEHLRRIRENLVQAMEKLKNCSGSDNALMEFDDILNSVMFNVDVPELKRKHYFLQTESSRENIALPINQPMESKDKEDTVKNTQTTAKTENGAAADTDTASLVENVVSLLSVREGNSRKVSQNGSLEKKPSQQLPELTRFEGEATHNLKRPIEEIEEKHAVNDMKRQRTEEFSERVQSKLETRHITSAESSASTTITATATATETLNAEKQVSSLYLPLMRAEQLTDESSRIKMQKILTTVLAKLSNHSYAWVFKDPVEGVKGYDVAIKKKTDLTNIRMEVENKTILTIVELWRQLMLMFNNSFVFNPVDSAYSFMAVEMQKRAEELVLEAFIQEALTVRSLDDNPTLLPSSLDDIFLAVREQGQDKTD